MYQIVKMLPPKFCFRAVILVDFVVATLRGDFLAINY